MDRSNSSTSVLKVKRHENTSENVLGRVLRFEIMIYRMWKVSMAYECDLSEGIKSAPAQATQTKTTRRRERKGDAFQLYLQLIPSYNKIGDIPTGAKHSVQSSSWDVWRLLSLVTRVLNDCLSMQASAKLYRVASCDMNANFSYIQVVNVDVLFPNRSTTQWPHTQEVRKGPTHDPMWPSIANAISNSRAVQRNT